MIRQFFDGLRALSVGLGSITRDKMAVADYAANLLTDDQLEAMYDSSWLAEGIVDIPPDDTFRQWRDWHAKPDDQSKIVEIEQQFLVRKKLQDTDAASRLYGGAALLIGTQELDLSKPLNPQREELRFLTVMNRRELTAQELERDPFSDNYGKPKWYEIAISNQIRKGNRIHPSRLVRFVGKPHKDPFFAAGTDFGWGKSSLRSAYETVKAADATCANVASMIFEAKVDVIRIPNFMGSLSDDRYKDAIIERIMLAMLVKGNNGALLLDKDEEYDTKQISFAQIPQLVERMLINVASASKIPVTKFLGISPAGLSATGEHDMKNYYDMIESRQALKITPACAMLDKIIVKTALGRVDEKIDYIWAPLEQTNEEERGRVGKLIGELTAILRDSGLFLDEELREITINALVAADIYPGLQQTIEKTRESEIAALFEEPETPEPITTPQPAMAEEL